MKLTFARIVRKIKQKTLRIVRKTTKQKTRRKRIEQKGHAERRKEDKVKEDKKEKVAESNQRKRKNRYGIMKFINQ